MEDTRYLTRCDHYRIMRWDGDEVIIISRASSIVFKCCRDRIEVVW